MTITEMYQEIVEQEIADIFLDEDGYIIDDYSFDNVIEIEYDEWSIDIIEYTLRYVKLVFLIGNISNPNGSGGWLSSRSVSY